MVTIEVFHGEGARSEQRWLLQLTPNRPLDDSATLYWLVALGIVPLGFALLLALAGFWPILPFAGLEIAVLAYGLFHTSNRNDQSESIELSADAIVIVKSESQLRWHERLLRALRALRGAAGEPPRPVQSSRVALQRAWARVELKRARSRWYPSTLSFVSHGKRIEVGAFLTESERQELNLRLRSILVGGNRAASQADLASIIPKVGEIPSN